MHRKYLVTIIAPESGITLYEAPQIARSEDRAAEEALFEFQRNMGPYRENFEVSKIRLLDKICGECSGQGWHILEPIRYGLPKRIVQCSTCFGLGLLDV